jgi:two-component system chemotaxis response regulator CheB
MEQMRNDKTLRVLVVDDTVVYRRIVSDALSGLPDIEVVGHANNGKIAMSRIASLKADLLILDIEMPQMNGLEVLAQMKTRFPDVEAIVLSSLTQEGGEITIKALELGAFDFIPKPLSGSLEKNKEAIRHDLASMLKAFARYKEIKSILKGVAPGKKTRAVFAGAVQRRKGIGRPKRTKSEIVGIGLSTGGPVALSKMMLKLPADLGVPVLIVQHMPPMFTRSLAESLDSKCALKVMEAVDGQRIRPNVALIAPGGKQMKIVAGADGKTRIIRITDDPRENSCRPSVDVLFRSIAHHYVGRATGVIMTGMGSDGTAGLKLMKDSGCTVVAQNEGTCIVYGMPKGPIEAGIADVIAPLDEIAGEIVKTVKD